MEIPTALFKVKGFKGKFKVSKKPVEFIGGRTAYHASWYRQGVNWKVEDASGETREKALRAVMEKAKRWQ